MPNGARHVSSSLPFLIERVCTTRSDSFRGLSQRLATNVPLEMFVPHNNAQQVGTEGKMDAV